MLKVILTISITFIAYCAFAAPTPMDFQVPTGTSTEIECKFNKKAPCPKWAYSEKNETLKLIKDKVFHYRLYLPEGYYENKDKKYPCIFISSPAGNAPLGNLTTWVTEHQWIAVMLVESQNSSPKWLANFVAAHDDVVKRCRIQEGMKYATGFSGGSRCASTQVGVRKGFAGLILQGAGFNYYPGTGISIPNGIQENKEISVCFIVGNEDKNKKELTNIRQGIPKRTPFKCITFQGGHDWAPEEKMLEAMEWIMEQLPKTTKSIEVSKKILATKLDSLEETENKFEKYETLEMLLKIVEKFKLQKDSEIKPHLKKLTQDLNILKKDKVVLNELKVKKSYNSIHKIEEKLRTKILKGKLKKKKKIYEFNRLITSYQKIADANDDTLYGNKASKKINAIKEEIKQL